jgi:periplasmic glucans biosynthesis protein
MRSIRLPMMLCVALLGGALGCGTEGDAPATADSSGSAPSAPALAPRETPTPWAARPDGPSLFQHVTAHARSLASSSYRAPDEHVTPTVAGLTYGQYRGIRFREEASLWRDEGSFRLQLFHPGAGNDTPVRIHLVESARALPLSFDPVRFSYGDELDGMDTTLPADAGHAGFRVLHPLNDSSRFDEVVSFLGASYFRLLGPGHVYGLSSRGIAVDIGLGDPEEFPDFTDFWIVRPPANAESLHFVGLLDGPSLTGAYRFELTPGSGERSGDRGVGGDESTRPTVLAVEARLFAREDVTKLGVAPLTSMYLHGTFPAGRSDDFRPRVHDSEGLLMHTSRGEWIWRPLTNRAAVRVTSLRDRSPLGYGLVQRTRDFASYMDLEAEYHRRPSEWVAVDGEWGPGGVELLEIPSASEFADNVVAYWVPQEPFRAGEERSYRYRLVTFDARLGDVALPGGDALGGQHLAQVVRSRIGWDALPGQVDPPPRTRRRVVIDYEHGGLSGLPEDAPVEARVSTSSGTIADVRVRLLPGGGRRATFSLDADPARGADMRVWLEHADTAVTETWSYLWEPGDAW